MPSSLLNLSSSARQSRSRPSGFFRLRLHVLSVMASIVDTAAAATLPEDNEYNALCLAVSDAVLVFNSTVYTDQSTNDVLNTANKITLSLNDVSLFEGMSSIAGELLSPSGPRRPLLNFYHIPQSNTVYSAPHCEITVDIMNDSAAATCSPQISVSVKLEPVLVSVVYRYIMRWLETLSGFVVNVSTDESSSAVSLTVSVAKIDVIVHPDPETATHVWDDLLLALDLESELLQEESGGIDPSRNATKRHYPSNVSMSSHHNDEQFVKMPSRWQQIGKTERGRNSSIPSNRNSFAYQLHRHLSGTRAGFRIQVL